MARINEWAAGLAGAVRDAAQEALCNELGEAFNQAVARANASRAVEVLSSMMAAFATEGQNVVGVGVEGTGMVPTPLEGLGFGANVGFGRLVDGYGGVGYYLDTAVGAGLPGGGGRC